MKTRSTLIAALLPAAAALHAAPPVNNDWSGRTPLTGALPLRVDASTAEATYEINEPNYIAFPDAGSIWWTWTAAADGWYEAHTDASSAPGVGVAVFQGSSVATLHPPADGRIVLTSKPGGYRAFPAKAGEMFHFAVTSEAPGPVSLNLRTASVPENDAFASRRLLSGAPVTDSIQLAGGSVEDGESTVYPLACPAHSFWWQWTAPAAGVYQVQLILDRGNSVPSEGGYEVLRGTSLTSLERLDFLELTDSYRMTEGLFLTAAAGDIFQIRTLVSDGPAALQIKPALRDNDSPEEARYPDFSSLASQNWLTLSDDTRGATTTHEIGLPDITGAALWWQFRFSSAAPVSMQKGFATEGETSGALYTGPDARNLTLVGTLPCSFTPVLHARYWLAVWQTQPAARFRIEITSTDSGGIGIYGGASLEHYTLPAAAPLDFTGGNNHTWRVPATGSYVFNLPGQQEQMVSARLSVTTAGEPVAAYQPVPLVMSLTRDAVVEFRASGIVNHSVLTMQRTYGPPGAGGEDLAHAQSVTSALPQVWTQTGLSATAGGYRYWSWTAPTSGTVLLESTRSFESYRSILIMDDGPEQIVASVEQSNSVALPVTAGHVYVFEVGAGVNAGYGVNARSFALRWITAPVHDTPAAALDMGAGLPASGRGILPAYQPEDVTHPLWWKWTAQQDGYIGVMPALKSPHWPEYPVPFPSDLKMFRGATPASMVQVNPAVPAEYYNGRPELFRVAAGETYWLRTSWFAEHAPNFYLGHGFQATLSLMPVAVRHPVNDHFADREAVALDGDSTVIRFEGMRWDACRGIMGLATVESGEPDTGNSKESAWYSFTPLRSGMYHLSTIGLPVYLYKGNTLTGLEPVPLGSFIYEYEEVYLKAGVIYSIAVRTLPVAGSFLGISWQGAFGGEGYADWLEAYGLSADTELGDPMSSPFKDGWTNGWKYHFGLDPRIHAGSDPMRENLPQALIAGDFLELRFRLVNGSVRGQVSADLFSWDWIFNGTMDYDEATGMTRYRVPLSTGGCAFLRLVHSQQP